MKMSESADYRSHFGKFEIEGVKIDVMGELERREGEHWKPTWARTLDLIDLEGVPVRVSWLEEETLGISAAGGWNGRRCAWRSATRSGWCGWCAGTSRAG